MKLLKILNYKSLCCLAAYLFVLWMTFDLAIGSYGESEPIAGNMLIIVGTIFVAIGVLVSMKLKPKYILWEKA